MKMKKPEYGNKNFDVALKIKAKHGRIYQYMQENNLTLDEFSEEIGIGKSTLFKILHFKWLPNDNYQSKKTMEKLVSFFNCPVKELFPQKLIKAIKNNKELASILQDSVVVYKKIDLEYLPFYSIPQLTYEAGLDEVIYNKERNEMICNVLKELNPQEETVIKKRFGIDDGKEYTLEEIGKELNVGRERIRQIEAKALRKLRIIPRFKRKLRNIY